MIEIKDNEQISNNFSTQSNPIHQHCQNSNFNRHGLDCGLKAFQYEADGIVPFVANSPFMSFFYAKDSPEYQAYKNPEGKTVQKNIAWHKENNTYTFAYGLGAVIVLIGVLTFWGFGMRKLVYWVLY